MYFITFIITSHKHLMWSCSLIWSIKKREWKEPMWASPGSGSPTHTQFASAGFLFTAQGVKFILLLQLLVNPVHWPEKIHRTISKPEADMRPELSGWVTPALRTQTLYSKIHFSRKFLQMSRLMLNCGEVAFCEAGVNGPNMSSNKMCKLNFSFVTQTALAHCLPLFTTTVWSSIGRYIFHHDMQKHAAPSPRVWLSLHYHHWDQSDQALWGR